MEETKAKRKTQPSLKSIHNYTKKNYKQFCAYVRNELYAEVDEYCKTKGISKPEFVRLAYELMKARDASEQE